MQVKIFKSWETSLEQDINNFLRELKKDGLVSHILAWGNGKEEAPVVMIFYDKYLDDTFPGFLAAHAEELKEAVETGKQMELL
jgi:hypothetical protein